MGIPHVVLLENTNEMVYASENNNEEIDYSKEYFTIEALEDGLTVQLSRNASEYRIDNDDWISLNANTATPSINSGQKISFKITNPTISTFYGIGSFTVSKAFNVEGNIMSLLHGDNFEGQIDLSGKDSAFTNLFYECTTLQNAENLILPATTLASNCYREMFNGCSSLQSIDGISNWNVSNVTTMMFMFNGCSSLTTAPELPATTLSSYCYSNMFYNCSSLTKTPELPAETLVDNCYYYMFGYCYSLAEVPMISAKTHASSSCSYMFYNCNQLNSVKVNFTSWNESNHYYWLYGVSSSGTFYKPDELPEEFGASRIPEGWTVKSINDSATPDEPTDA